MPFPVEQGASRTRRAAVRRMGRCTRFFGGRGALLCVVSEFCSLPYVCPGAVCGGGMAGSRRLENEVDKNMRKEEMKEERKKEKGRQKESKAKQGGREGGGGWGQF